MKENPHYRDLGDHTEAVSIDFDPKVISYGDLLKYFWASHHCQSNIGGRQYMKAVFFRSQDQRALAMKSLDAHAKASGISPTSVATQIVPVRSFTYAEGYHQQYMLTRHVEIRSFLEEIYPSEKSLADSAVATRLNAFLGNGIGNDDGVALRRQLPSFELPRGLERFLR